MALIALAIITIGMIYMLIMYHTSPSSSICNKPKSYYKETVFIEDDLSEIKLVNEHDIKGTKL